MGLVSDKIVETYSSRVTSESIRIHTPPLSPPFKVGVFFFFLKVAPTVAQHCVEGMGEEKLYFPLLKSGKRQKAPLGQNVSTYFVADCRNMSRRINGWSGYVVVQFFPLVQFFLNWYKIF